MQTLARKYSIDSILFVFGFAIVCYLILRTYFIDITDDEAWSYFNVKQFWYVETLCSGNTHWFNFAAIKLAVLLGLEKAYHLRWFSLLSGIVFLGFIFNWIKSIEQMYLKLFAFAFIFFNPYLLEYLTLARGYSTGLCFLMASLFFLNKCSQNTSFKFQTLALFFAGISAIANFGFFYFFIAFCAFYFLHFYFKHGFTFLKSTRFYLEGAYVLSIVFLVLRALLFIKECSNDLSEFGGDSFITSVLGSYIDTLLYHQISLHPLFKLCLAIVLFSVICISIFVGVFKFKNHRNWNYYFVSIILALMIGFTVFNYWCFHVLYPTERTSLLFYPLFCMSIVGLLSYVFKSSTFKKYVLCFLSGVLTLNFCVNIHLVSGYDHSYCMNTKPYFDYLKSIKAKSVGLPIELYFVYLKYYNVIDQPFYAESIIRWHYNKRWIIENKIENFEYLLIMPPYDLSYYQNSKCSFEPIKYFTETKGLIVKVHKQ